MKSENYSKKREKSAKSQQLNKFKQFMFGWIVIFVVIFVWAKVELLEICGMRNARMAILLLRKCDN